MDIASSNCRNRRDRNRHHKGMSMTLHDRIAEIEERCGGLRKAARVLEIDPAYLYRLKTGKKKNPSLLILRKLGLKREIVYVLSGENKHEYQPEPI